MSISQPRWLHSHTWSLVMANIIIHFYFLIAFAFINAIFRVITFAKLSGHAETSVALLQDKFSINYTTIPFNQVPYHWCYSNKSISYFFWDSRYGLFQLVFCTTVADKKILICWNPRFMSLLGMHWYFAQFYHSKSCVVDRLAFLAVFRSFLDFAVFGRDGESLDVLKT